MAFSTMLYLAMMSMGSHGDSILYAYQHYRPSEPNVKLPVPFLTGTAQTLVKRSGDHLIFAEAIDQELLNRQTSIVVNELKLYPDALLEKSNVRQIIFCKTLYAGSLQNTRAVGGLAVHEHHSIILDACCCSPQYLPTAFHHEMFHFMDRQMGFGSFDAEWLSLNDPGFRYFGYDYRRIYTEGESIDFISAYSQAAMVEDKAEVFAHLITEPTLIEYRAKRSQVLQRKVDCIKRRMQAFCPEFNDKYWHAIYARAEARNPRNARRYIESSTEASTYQPSSDKQLSNQAAKPDNAFTLFRPPYTEPAPPISDFSKIIVFLGVMLAPWYLWLIGSSVIARLFKRTKVSSPDFRS